MNASSIIRKLKDLDALEIRVKQTVNPNQQMLQAITKEKAELLAGKQEEPKK